ncbi:MAG: T9SS type A sorting domain-containing protein [Chitinophagales bacterium]
MKKILLLSFLYFLLGSSFFVMSQNPSPTLSFDGIDDYVDLGSEIGNGVRTIELWFRPSEDIDPSVPNFIPLVARDTDVCNPGSSNVDEFSLAFQPSFLPNSGSLRFDISEMQGNSINIFSDINSWKRGKWHHVAAVVHPNLGMMLFIDGMKQSDAAYYSSATAPSDCITAIASWGNRIELDRYFAGNIEDVRFSSEAIYTQNFMPECPDISALPSTSGVWNFNENTGNTVIDASTNNYEAEIVGAEFETVFICESTPTNISELNLTALAEVYPNPSNDYIIVSLNDEFGGNFVLYNSLGQKVLSKQINGLSKRIDIQKLAAGIYLYQIEKNSEIIAFGKLIKNVK